MDSNRRYNEDEVAQILEGATEAQKTGGRSLAPVDGMSLEELREIGREVGIPADLITRAAAALDAPGMAMSPNREFMGTPIGVGRTIHFDRRLKDDEWNRLVVDLRETFDARGRVREEGSFRQWKNGNLQALLEPTESGERLRLRTVKGDARASLTLGAGLLGLVPLILMVSLVTGVLGDPGTLELPALFAVAGALLFGNSRLRLPGWAATRAQQMEDVADRLIAAVETADRADPQVVE